MTGRNYSGMRSRAQQVAVAIRIEYDIDLIGAETGMSARLFGLVLLTGTAWAGRFDYYECQAPDGGVSYSIERCAKGERQRRIQDDSPPESMGIGAGKGGVIRLEGRRGAHFYADILINGTPVRAVVDTGATAVAIGPGVARRAGVDLRRGVAGMSHTANGTAATTAVSLDSVELGGNVVRGVAGSVLGQELGGGIEALLGMSFLKHFEVNTDGYVMTLRPK